MLPRETNICRRSHGLGDQGDRAAGGEAPDRPRTYTVWLIVLGLNGLYHASWPFSHCPSRSWRGQRSLWRAPGGYGSSEAGLDIRSRSSPHGVSLVLRGAANGQLAVARSVEPLGRILAVHPDSAVGNCEHRGIRAASRQVSQADYSACYAQYSAWSATWAHRVRSADVILGTCEVRGVPVTVSRSNGEWPVWWVLLRHIGGLPRQYFELVIAIDSRACAAVTRPTGS